jgi:hypothetical protein
MQHREGLVELRTELAINNRTLKVIKTMLLPAQPTRATVALRYENSIRFGAISVTAEENERRGAM